MWIKSVAAVSIATFLAACDSKDSTGVDQETGQSVQTDDTLDAGEIETKAFDIVATLMGVDKDSLTRDTRFVEDLGADSLDLVELVMEFEDTFEITITDDEAENIKTLGQAIDFVKSAREGS
jgi:acyl carrier protein